MWEKFLNQKKKKNKWINNNSNNNNNIIKKYSEKTKENKIKKLIKMIMEAKMLKLSWHYYTMKMRNNSKTKHVGKKITDK